MALAWGVDSPRHDHRPTFAVPPSAHPPRGPRRLGRRRHRRRARRAAARRPRPRARRDAHDRGRRAVLRPHAGGPYYIDGALVRRTITERKAGVALDLRLTVVDSSTCSPIAGATVEIWHADALGLYSGFGAGASSRTFLRGAQRSDAHGLVEFKTLYPGWYRGRTPHIHVKVHVGGQTVHTGQLYFRDATTRRVYERAPYRSHGEPDTTNAADNIYGAGGSKSLLALRRRGRGYVGRLTMGVRT